MNTKQKFCICKICGNITGFVENKGAPLTCCGEKMSELTPNTVEAATEKHLPAVTVTGDSIEVKIGSVAHPMEDVHYIMFVYVETERGGQRKNLNIGEAPELKFTLVNDKALAVYAYCNLHGLWKTEV